MLPSEILKLPTDPPARGFPTVWKLLLYDSLPGQVSIPNAFVSLYFIFCPITLQREWTVFLGAWCPLPAFRSCFMKVAQHSGDLLMSLWERKRSPRPIPLPSWDCPPEYIICRCFLLFSKCIFILLCLSMFPLCPLC